MNNQQDIIDDRIDVVTRGLLGLTVTCARCHDHKFDPIPTRDYYSLYGIFASSGEPTVPPLFQEPPRTPAYEKFDKELRERERKLTEFVVSKHDELVQLAKSRSAEYLLAAQVALGQPNTEDFMLVADGTDLNPKMLLRWKVYLARTKKQHDPVFVPWHALAALSGRDFVAQSEILYATWARAPETPVPEHQSARGRVPGIAVPEIARRGGARLCAAFPKGGVGGTGIRPAIRSEPRVGKSVADSCP